MCDTLTKLQSECFEIQTDEERIEKYIDTFTLMLKHYYAKHNELPLLMTIMADNNPLDVMFHYKMQNDIT